MTNGPEWEKVEHPLLSHLSSLGWETLNWSERQADGVDARYRIAMCFLSGVLVRR